MGGSTLVALLDEVADRDGGTTPALISGDNTVTYAELRDRAARVAAGFAHLGIGPGDRVALWLPNCVEYVEACFAIARLGAIAVAVNTRYRAHEVQDILTRSGARALLLWPGFKDIDFLSIVAGLERTALSALDTLVLVGEEHARPPDVLTGLRTAPYSELRDTAPTPTAPPPDAGIGDARYAVFTSSGTTSVPKLVVHSQGGVTAHARSVAHAFGYAEPHAVVLCMLPLCGVFGFDTLMSTLAGGATAVIMPVFDADEAVRLIERHRVTHTNGADDMLRRILAADHADNAGHGEHGETSSRITSLREAGFASFTGDAAALVAAGDTHGMRFFQTYGASEVHALNCYQPPGTSAERRALGGGPLVSPDYDVRVRDPQSGSVLAPGEHGMIEIGGPHVMVGFLGDEAAQRDAFTDDGYVRTGDLGHVEEDGFVYLARMGDALRLGGFLVNPREIEEFLEGLPGVAGAQVVGAPTPGGTVAVGFVVSDGTEHANRLDEDELIGACRAQLARFKVPRRIVELPAFPTTNSANGVKIRRVELRDRAIDLLR